MDELTTELNNKLIEIRNEYVAKNSNTFMVTADPSIAGLSLVKSGLSYLSDTDCFHPSELAHGQVAKAMWNNLFRPFDQKIAGVDSETNFECPQSDFRIRF